MNPLNLDNRISTLCVLILLVLSSALYAEEEVPIPVRISKQNGNFILLRNGKPFGVHAVSGYAELDTAIEAGANTIRTWSIGNLDDGRLLDEAHKRGMGVVVGLWMGHTTQGFDYSDPEMVARQYETVTKDVLKYKDHPAVLIWAVGNEAEMRGGQPYEAINQIAKFIHEVDPHHPTMAVVAGLGGDRIGAIRIRAPEIDILGINIFDTYNQVPERLARAGWTGPYMVTEFGINGTWDKNYRTDWDVPLEPPSGIKAEIYRERYQFMMKDKEQCLGVFPFMWGYVPKGTPTWFSLFYENGEPNAVVDVMQHIWTGRWPEDRSPWVTALDLNGQPFDSSIRLRPEQAVTAEVKYEHADPETLGVKWEILPEQIIVRKQGPEPLTVTGLDIDIEVIDAKTIRFNAPAEPGAYRLYFYGYSPEEKLGTANAPFLVE